MYVFKSLHRLQFHKDALFHQEICRKVAYWNSVVLNTNAILLLKPQAIFADFVRQRILVDLFNKPGPQAIRNS